MSSSAKFLNPSEAARQLGVSTKALRLYENRGIISPIRTASGWRVYGPSEMAQATKIVNLRTLGLSLGKVAEILRGDARCLGRTLAAHQAALEGQVLKLTSVVERVRCLRDALADGTPTSESLTRVIEPTAELNVVFNLPWPWGGERFELKDIRPLNYIIGPLGSGKTRLAKRIAEILPDALFLGLDRFIEGGATVRVPDAALKSRVDQALSRLVEEGATASTALLTLLDELQAERQSILVIDMLEHGLDRATQEALRGYLRCRGPGARPLFILTRSSAILKLQSVGSNEAIILCPANHSPPSSVSPQPGAPGYEAVATCLASPEVRARAASCPPG